MTGVSEKDAPEQAVTDAQKLALSVKLLLDFATTQSAVKISPDKISEAQQALLASPIDEAKLRLALNNLTTMVSPATIDSIKDIQDLTDDLRKRSGVWRLWWHDHFLRGHIRWSVLWVLSTLYALVIGQFAVLYISSFLGSIEVASKQYEEFKQKLEGLEFQINTLTASTENNNRAALTSEKDRLEAKMANSEAILKASFNSLREWSVFYTFSLPIDEGTRMEFTPENFFLLTSAYQSILKGLGLYILPLIYGLFGANIYVLRSVMVKLDTWTLNSISYTKQNLRRTLGALLGATTGLLYADGGTFQETITNTGFSLPFVAFLAGYSSELFFSLLDNIITNIKNAFAPSKGFESEHKPAAGQQG